MRIPLRRGRSFLSVSIVREVGLNLRSLVVHLIILILTRQAQARFLHSLSQRRTQPQDGETLISAL